MQPPPHDPHGQLKDMLKNLCICCALCPCAIALCPFAIALRGWNETRDYLWPRPRPRSSTIEYEWVRVDRDGLTLDEGGFADGDTTYLAMSQREVGEGPVRLPSMV